ncbi:Globin-coupled histidine kinase [Longibacter salinarum]|uniref:Globin-coupled histidine kinase n=1 Tax=Longibacter salinarum TaxID=1850348 RepID=A0A2A8CUI5_9BACT|nr:protoglobin domain-containing protein [Longibacter salinarum]PEN11414.1 Globin-coupled histidine kinase [Longibacter salinarum]
MENYQERKSWSVKQKNIHAELADLMNLSDTDKELLSNLQSEAEEQTNALTDDFYERLLAHENTKEYLEGEDMDDRHAMIADWFVDLFSGSYDEEYVAHRLNIGHIHVRIGLPVRYPLSMIDVISRHGENVVAKSSDPEQAKRAFQKALSLDIAVFNQAYEDRQLKHLADLVGGERLARRLLTGGAGG